MTRRTLPASILAGLIDAGTTTADRTTEVPTWRPCPRCGLQTVVALDAGKVTLSPYLLTPAGELAALLAGAATFAVDPAWIRWRDPAYIKARPANQANILAIHECAPFPFDSRGIVDLRAKTFTIPPAEPIPF